MNIIKSVSSLKLERIFLIVGKHKDMIYDEISKYDSIDLNKIVLIEQKDQLGTGHAIQCCVPELKKYENLNVVVLNGDVPLIRAETIKNLIITNQNNTAILSTTVINPYGYGRIVEDKNNNFLKIVEESDASEEIKKIKKINTGIYFFQSFLLIEYISKLTNNNEQNEYYLTDIFSHIRNVPNNIINIVMMNNNNNYEIMGVNTQEQLINVEKYYNKHIYYYN